MITMYAGKRGIGKTTALLAWLVGGEPKEGYPGWTRVLLVPGPGTDQLELIKPMFTAMIEAKAEAEDVPTPTWAEMDFAHRIYTIEEWGRAANVDLDVEVALDGLDQMMVRPQDVPGQVVKFTLWAEVEVRQPDQGMTLEEAVEHAGAADARYATLRGAVRDLKMKPGRTDERGLVVGGDVAEGGVLNRLALTRLAHLYYAAAEYDWLHPGDEILGPPPEPGETSGVAPMGKVMSKSGLVGFLSQVLAVVEADDSFEGSLAYEMTVSEDDRVEPDFRVQAAVRAGNSMGQGGIMLIREGLEPVR